MKTNIEVTQSGFLKIKYPSGCVSALRIDYAYVAEDNSYATVNNFCFWDNDLTDEEEVSGINTEELGGNVELIKVVRSWLEQL